MIRHRNPSLFCLLFGLAAILMAVFSQAAVPAAAAALVAIGGIASDTPILALTPTADHSAKEGYFVKFSSGNAALVSATSDLPIGVITEPDSTTGKVSVALWNYPGIVHVKVKASSPGTIAAGTLLQIHSDGTVLADAGTGARVTVAMALESGAADELIRAVLFKPLSYAS